MEECIFCKIVEGEIPSLKVYEDNNCIAFLDINPCSPGHTIVIPRRHYPLLTDMPDDLVKDIFAAVSLISRAVQSVTNAQGLTVGTNVGKAAGQEVPHVHIHIIPRFEGDKGAAIQHIVRMPVNKEELPGYADKIRSAIGKFPSPKEEEKKEAPKEKGKKPKWYFSNE